MTLHLGDCLEVLKTLPDNSIDSVVTDPPYGLTSNKKGGSGVASIDLNSPYGRARIGTGNGSGGFMGMMWDSGVPPVDIWREVLRVLKPGGHFLSFGGTRTYHRLVVNIEDAGFEIRDQLQWLYGSGFPKSMDISKAIDKAAGAEREVVGTKDVGPDMRGGNFSNDDGERMIANITAPSTPEAKQWAGWGTALKPANEPICLARKPVEGTIASNVLRYGTGALNIDASRIATSDNLNGGAYAKTGNRNISGSLSASGMNVPGKTVGADFVQPQGRFPSNLLLDETAAALLDQQSDGVSRFFYCAKAAKSERNAGLEGMPVDKTPKFTKGGLKCLNCGKWKNSGNACQCIEPHFEQQQWNGKPSLNHHPTVKPIKLMQYLITLITPPKGVVLDPFMGSGSTGVAAKQLGFDFVGIERDASYYEIAEKRISVTDPAKSE